MLTILSSQRFFGISWCFCRLRDSICHRARHTEPCLESPRTPSAGADRVWRETLALHLPPRKSTSALTYRMLSEFCYFTCVLIQNLCRETLVASNFAVTIRWVTTRVSWSLWRSYNPASSHPWTTSRRRSRPWAFYTANTSWNTKGSATAWVIIPHVPGHTCPWKKQNRGAFKALQTVCRSSQYEFGDGVSAIRQPHRILGK